MDTFLALNRKKLRFAFFACSLIFLGLAGIVLTIAYFTGNSPNAKLLFAIVAGAGIVFPLFIILLAYMGWHLKRLARKRAFSKSPFDQLESIGFYKSYLNLKTKWFFTEEIKEGKINGFTLTADINRETNRIIEIEVPVEWQQLNKEEYKRLSEKFKQFNIEFRIGSLVKIYDTKRLTFHTIQELEGDLKHFTQTLRQEKFEPKK